jgi:hypothetical protein
MARETWHITRTGHGQGSFLCPPGHPAHVYSVIEGPANNPRTSMSIESAAQEDWVPQHIRERAAKIIANATLIESEGWLRHVYGYFRSMYLPESGERNVSTLLSAKRDELPDERHAAVAAVREYFPDHAPRADLIADSYTGRKLYGSYPCVHCAEAVQYEARVDGLAVFGRGAGHVCAKAPDGRHAWEPVSA